VYIAGLGATIVSQTNFTNSTFLSNAANLTSAGVLSGGGGAVYLDGGITVFNGSTFQQNNASKYGGALVYVHECFPGTTNTSVTDSLQKNVIEFTAFASCDIVGHASCASCCSATAYGSGFLQ